MYSNNAKKCFSENLRLFANPTLEPEKYNLYNGLLNLAEAIKGIEQRIKYIKNEIDDIAELVKLVCE